MIAPPALSGIQASAVPAPRARGPSVRAGASTGARPGVSPPGYPSAAAAPTWPAEHFADPTTRRAGADGGALIAGYRGWFGADRAAEEEEWVPPARIRGALPPDLAGSYFKLCIGVLSRAGERLENVYDGDGLVARVSFPGDGTAHFLSRIVRTPEFEEEEAQGRWLFPSVFSKRSPSGARFNNPLRIANKNPANVQFVRLAGGLFTCGDGGLPCKLDPATLDTVASRCTTFGPGDPRRPDIGYPYQGSHSRVAPGPGGAGPERLCSLCRDRAGRDARSGRSGVPLRLTEWAMDGRVAGTTDYLMEGETVGLLHDWVVTENFYVVPQNPLRLNLGALLTGYALGRRSLVSCFDFDGEGDVRLHVIPRPGGKFDGEPARVVPMGPGFVFHLVNGYETDGGRGLVVDCVPKRAVDFASYSIGSTDAITEEAYSAAGRPNFNYLERWGVDLEAGAGVRSRVMDAACEFPRVRDTGGGVEGRPSRHAYVCSSRVVGEDGASGPFQAVSKVTVGVGAGARGPLSAADVAVASWDAGHRRLVMEPLFVPRAGSSEEDDGYVLVHAYDWERRESALAVLDARDLPAGPVAEVVLPSVLPNGLHGIWSPEYYGPGEA